MLPDWLWLLIASVFALALSLAGRWIHHHLHGLGLLITGKSETAMYAYAIPLLPGVLVHELSHGLMAMLLGVRVGGLSLFPQQQDGGAAYSGGIRLGLMQTVQTDKLRGSLIGAAPFIGGGLVAALIAQAVLGAGMREALLLGTPMDIVATFAAGLPVTPLWALYLLFAIANALWPSPTDRRDWLPAVVGLGVLVVFVVVAGAGSTLAALIAPLAAPIVAGLRWLAVAFALALIADAPFMALIAAAEWAVGTARGQRINYGVGLAEKARQAWRRWMSARARARP